MKHIHYDQVATEEVIVPGAKGVRVRWLISSEDGAPHFYMRRYELAPGGRTPWHAHPWEHEVYILSGAGTLVTPEGEHPLSAGDCVFVPPNEEHQFRNTGPGELKMLCLVPKDSG